MKNRRTIVLTGASSGIGKATALALAKTGYRVIVVGREGTKAQVAMDEVTAAATGEAPAFIPCDLANRDQIVAACKKIRATTPHVDTLINNAALYPQTWQENAAGVEMCLAVNVLAPFLLSEGLIDSLAAAPDGRIVNVSSVGERYANVDWDDLMSVRNFNPNLTYNNSKLLLTLLTYEQARQYADRGVTANCLHPGGVRTDLVKSTRGLSWPARLMYTLLRPVMATPEKGARTSIHLATSARVEGMTGGYFVNCKRARSSSTSYDPALAARVWALCERLGEGLETAKSNP